MCWWAGTSTGGQVLLLVGRYFYRWAGTSTGGAGNSTVFVKDRGMDPGGN